MDPTHELPVLLEQVPERAIPKRDVHGLRRAPPEPGVETGLRQRLLEHREVGAAAASSPRLGRRLPHEVATPLLCALAGSLLLSFPAEQPGEDVGEEPVIPALALFTGQGHIERLRTPRPLPLAALGRHEPGVLETPEVWPERVRVKRQPNRQLA